MRSPVGNKRWSRINCSTISWPCKFRSTPSKPLAQNTQPIAQPTWLLRQTVRRIPSRNRTHSTEPPPASCNNSFSVPSGLVWWRTISVDQNANCSCSCRRTGLGRSVISSIDWIEVCVIQCSIWSARYDGNSAALIQARSAVKSARYCRSLVMIDFYGIVSPCLRPRRHSQHTPTRNDKR